MEGGAAKSIGNVNMSIPDAKADNARIANTPATIQ
jgi:hypothetical protein